MDEPTTRANASPLQRVRRQMRLRYRAFTALRLLGRIRETVRYGLVRPTVDQRFHIVSAQRNSGASAERCLDSVFAQRYDRARIRHVFIDDDSTDDTHARVLAWLDAHPGHSVEYRHNDVRVGGTKNTLDGYALAQPGSIVIELNGDDWLHDPDVLAFLNKVYADPGVWLTYNTSMTTHGRISGLRPIPSAVTRRNTFRAAEWYCSHLRTFRMELMAHMDHDYMIDPETGEYWSNADDQAFFLCLLELAGPHARHIYRLMHVYNLREDSEFCIDSGGQRERVQRMRSFKPHRPIASLKG